MPRPKSVSLQTMHAGSGASRPFRSSATPASSTGSPEILDRMALDHHQPVDQNLSAINGNVAVCKPAPVLVGLERLNAGDAVLQQIGQESRRRIGARRSALWRVDPVQAEVVGPCHAVSHVDAQPRAVAVDNLQQLDVAVLETHLLDIAEAMNRPSPMPIARITQPAIQLTSQLMAWPAFPALQACAGTPCAARR